MKSDCNDWMNLHDFGHGTDANILDEVQRSKFLIEHIRWGLPPFHTPLLVAVVYLHEQNLTRRRVRVPPWLSIHNKQKILSFQNKSITWILLDSPIRNTVVFPPVRSAHAACSAALLPSSRRPRQSRGILTTRITNTSLHK